jgi:chorismate lyase
VLHWADLFVEIIFTRIMSARTALLNSFQRQHWRSAKRRQPLPAHWRPWLTDRGSLTRRLVQASQHSFSVERLRQGWQTMRPSEQVCLQQPAHHWALIREVMLRGHQQDWVFARSIIPRNTLRGRHRALRSLGNQSLGSWLFSDPSIQRGDLEICRLEDQHSVYWARRSIFRLEGQPLLVIEVFLPSLRRVEYPG